MREEPMTTTVWLDEETFALLMRVVDHLEIMKGRRVTSGQAIAFVLQSWAEQQPPLTG